jgi:superfamily II DNA or RNA helicase
MANNAALSLNGFSNYQAIFDALTSFHKTFQTLFTFKTANKGRTLFRVGGLSHLSIRSCREYELKISGVVEDKFSVEIDLSLQGMSLHSSLSCSCNNGGHCEHIFVVLQGYFNEGWETRLTDFIKAPLSKSEVKVLQVERKSVPLSPLVEQCIGGISAAANGSGLYVNKIEPVYSIGFKLVIARSSNKARPHNWYVIAGAFFDSVSCGIEYLEDFSRFKEILSRDGFKFDRDDAQLLSGLNALNSDNSERANFGWAGREFCKRGDLLLKAAHLGKLFKDAQYGRFRVGEELRLNLGWRADKKGDRHPAFIDLPNGVIVLDSSYDLIYYDRSDDRIGRVVLEGQTVPVEQWFKLPKIKSEQSESLLIALHRKRLPILGLEDIANSDVIPEMIEPKVRLTVFNTGQPLPAWYGRPEYQLGAGLNLITIAQQTRNLYLISLSFVYGETEINRALDGFSGFEVFEAENRYLRNSESERQAIATLRAAGVFPASALPFYSASRSDLLFASSAVMQDYHTALLATVKQLAELAERHGWEFSAPHELTPISLELGELQGGLLEEAESDWFRAELRVESDGKQFDLGEMFVTLLKSGGAQLEALERSTNEKVVVMLPNQSIEIERVRLLRLARLLSELSDPDGQDLRFNRYTGYAFENALLNACGRWETSEAIAKLRERISKMQKQESIAEPPEFQGSLRDYQQHGLAWLSNITEAELGGVLADDMGLGKTVQIIALMLLERARGRKGINLVVCPKSVVPNWTAELARFAPSFKVYQAIGSDRERDLAAINSVDLVITNYAILFKDIELLKQVDFNLAIFDEAQAIKNPKTGSYHAAQLIKARMKIPVSGTPLENNLQDLWAHFNLTMPGFLYSLDSFKKIYRNPIEKDGNVELREHLAARIKPFVMRRTKQEVVKDLPPLTEIIKPCELDGPQRDLYETIRQLTIKKVKDALNSKGAKRSHIEFLDALLKLRQVCCDPRLVKTESAKKVKRSAKLELLFQLLPSLLEEGRSIVLFSQFTSMLALIEQGVKDCKIPYSFLTGETEDRQTPIKQFQSGETRLFLMSLKAGGVGINLTTADTVVIYDPWWNPAVEAQAICRAHRIGQQNPVFAYRLIAEGTIEEKILDLQARKRSLVENLLADNEKPPELSEDLVNYLFAPIGKGDSD